MRIFGIEIENKTDILAFAAFVISMISIISQITMMIRGPEVHLFAPDQVMIHFEEYPEGKRYARIAARMAYVNRGAASYNDIVQLETVSFKLGDNTYTQVWQHFIQNIHEEEHVLLIEKTSVLPTPVNGGSLSAHETYFAPRPDLNTTIAQNKNFLEKATFLKALQNQDQIAFEFKAQTYADGWERVECVIDTKSCYHYLISSNHVKPICR
jgi:hypothetical protein